MKNNSRRVFFYTVVPAAIGATVGVIAQKMGYDFSAVEGMKQAVMASLPAAALFTPSNLESLEKTSPPLKKYPYFGPTASAGVLALTYVLGGMGMEWLSDREISQGFTGVVGGLEGAIYGIMQYQHLARQKNRE